MDMVEALELRLLPWSPILCDDDDDEDDDDFDFESYDTPGGY